MLLGSISGTFDGLLSAGTKSGPGFLPKEYVPVKKLKEALPEEAQNDTGRENVELHVV